MYVLPLSLSQLFCFGFALLFAFVFVITFAFAIYGVAFLLCVRGLYLLIPRDDIHWKKRSWLQEGSMEFEEN